MDLLGQKVTTQAKLQATAAHGEPPLTEPYLVSLAFSSITFSFNCFPPGALVLARTMGHCRHRIISHLACPRMFEIEKELLRLRVMKAS